eukprot:scaffold2255_cov259-Pinguiococcus_pyrenoidosus.AAC.8
MSISRDRTRMALAQTFRLFIRSAYSGARPSKRYASRNGDAHVAVDVRVPPHQQAQHAEHEATPRRVIRGLDLFQQSLAGYDELRPGEAKSVPVAHEDAIAAVLVAKLVDARSPSGTLLAFAQHLIFAHELKRVATKLLDELRDAGASGAAVQAACPPGMRKGICTDPPGALQGTPKSLLPRLRRLMEMPIHGEVASGGCRPDARLHAGAKLPLRNVVGRNACRVRTFLIPRYYFEIFRLSYDINL